MDVLDFPKEAKPREIFVYTCQRIVEPLIARGFKYRKSSNDAVKSDHQFKYAISFQPSIKLGSTSFSIHLTVSSEKLASWRKERSGEDDFGIAIGVPISTITHHHEEWPHYCVQTLLERERVITELTQQVLEVAIPFFERFQNLDNLVKEVSKNGFLPHRKMLNRLNKKRDSEFCQCFAPINQAA